MSRCQYVEGRLDVAIISNRAEFQQFVDSPKVFWLDVTDSASFQKFLASPKNNL